MQVLRAAFNTNLDSCAFLFVLISSFLRLRLKLELSFTFLEVLNSYDCIMNTHYGTTKRKPSYVVHCPMASCSSVLENHKLPRAHSGSKR